MHGFTVLGIETSCDETAAAIVRGPPPGPGEILSNVIHAQLDHEAYGGVVPEIAARAHVEMLDGVVERCLEKFGIGLDKIDAIAATAGPGLIGGVMVGLLTAKALALSTRKPLIAVNHLEAHALTARLTARVDFPFLLLLISGGHCQLMAVEGVGRYRLYGATIDDALGEAYDKTAKLLGLPYPGGPKIEVLAAQGRAKRFPFPRPMLGRAGADFSFSGLKTAVRQTVSELAVPVTDSDKADIAAGFQAAVLDVLRDRTRTAMQKFRTEFGNTNDECNFVVAGGVASNAAIRGALTDLANQEGFALHVPPAALCTDNGAMIAWAGVERLAAGLTDSLDFAPRARWPLIDLRPLNEFAK